MSNIGYEQAVLLDSPSLYWPYWNIGSIVDQSGFGWDGTLVGSPTLAAGPIVGDDVAIDLNGSSQYVSSSYSPFVDGATRTFEGWSWRDTSTTGDVLFSGNAASHSALRINANTTDLTFWPDTAVGGVNWQTVQGITAWPGNAQWVYWVLVFNDTSNAVTLWINGVAKATGSATNPYPVGGAGTFKIGARGATTTDTFDGKQGQIAVYEYGLSGARIRDHYLIGKGLHLPQLTTANRAHRRTPHGLFYEPSNTLESGDHPVPVSATRRFRAMV